jgi:hypothetical protein
MLKPVLLADLWSAAGAAPAERQVMNASLETLLGDVRARRGDEPGHYQNGEGEECDCDHFLAPSAEPVGCAIPCIDWKSR